MSNVIWTQESPLRKALSVVFAIVLSLGLAPTIPASAWADGEADNVTAGSLADGSSGDGSTEAADSAYSVTMGADRYSVTGATATIKATIVDAQSGAALSADEQREWSLVFSEEGVLEVSKIAWKTTGAVDFSVTRCDATSLLSQEVEAILMQGNAERARVSISIAPRITITTERAIGFTAGRSERVSKLSVNGQNVNLADYRLQSADLSIASVGNGEDGVVITPQKAGTARFTVSKNDDPSITAETSVVVKDAIAMADDVPYSTLTQAFKVAQNGSRITLCQDTVESVNYTGNKPRVRDFAITLDLNGHMLTGDSKQSYALRVDYGIITITDSAGGGGIHYGKDYAIIVSHVAADCSSKVVIDGGTFTGRSSVVQVGLPGGTGKNYKYYGGDLVVNGGTFVTVPDADETYDANGNFKYTLNMLDMKESNYAGGIPYRSSISVTGGTFQRFDPMNNSAEGANTDFTAEGYVSVRLASGDYFVARGTAPEAVALVPGNPDVVYGTLAEALGAVQDGQTIELLASVDIDSKLELAGDKNVTLHLGGHSHSVQAIRNAADEAVDAGESAVGFGSITVKDGATLAVKNGSISSGNGLEPILVADGGTVVVGANAAIASEKGTALSALGTGVVEVNGDSAVVRSSATSNDGSIPAIAATGKSSVRVINGYVGTDREAAAIIAYDAASVLVNGGTVRANRSKAAAVVGSTGASSGEGTSSVSVAINSGVVENAGTGGVVSVGGNGSLTIAGGAISSASGMAMVGIADAASLDMSDGVVAPLASGSNTGAPALEVSSTGTNTVTGGTLRSSSSNYTVRVLSGAQLSISGNARVENLSGNVDCAGIQAGRNKNNTGTVNISGGTFVAQAGTLLKAGSGSTIKVDGGWFSSKVPAGYCAPLMPTDAVGEEPAPYTVGTAFVKAYNGSAVLEPLSPQAGQQATLTLTPNGLADEDVTNDFVLAKLVVNDTDVTAQVTGSEYRFTVDQDAQTVLVQAYFTPASGAKAKQEAAALAQKANGEDGSPTWADIDAAVSWYTAASEMSGDELADDEEGTVKKLHQDAVKAAKDSLDSIKALDMTGQELEEDAAMSDLSSFERLEVLNLSNMGIADLSGLNVPRNLKALDLSDNPLVSLEGINEVAPALETLIVSDAGITVDVLAPAAALEDLVSLDASNNAGLQDVSAFSGKALDSLNISNTGIITLANIPAAKTLNAQNLDMTRTNRDALKALVDAATAEGFDASACSWNLEGSVLNDAEGFDASACSWNLEGSVLNDAEGSVLVLREAFEGSEGVFAEPIVLLNGVELLQGEEAASRIEAALLDNPIMLTAVAVPAHASVVDPVAWTSSDPSVVVVSETGELTFVGAGQATITASVKDVRDTAKSVSCDVTVSKANATLEVSINGWTYGQVANEPTFQSNVADDRTPTYTYSTDREGSYSADVPTNAGSYYVKGALEETATYSAAEDVCEFTIAKAEIEPTVAIEGWTYGSDPATPTVGGNEGNALVTYEYAPLGSESFSTEAPSAVGIYIVRATVAQSDNYNGGVATAEFAIDKAGIAPSVVLQGWAFGNAPNNPVVLGNTGNGEVTYTYATAEGEQLEGVPTNAGNYTVTANIAATDSYNGETCSADFAIARADLEPVVAIQGWSYRSDANEPQVSGLPEGIEAVVQYFDAEGERLASAPQGVGTYYVQAFVDQTQNYNAASSERVAFQISKASPVVNVAPQATAFTYDGTPKPLVTPGSATLGAQLVYWLEGQSENPSTTIPTATSVGNYRVYYKVLGDDSYNETVPVAVDVQIALGIPTVTAPVPRTGLVYDGTEQQLVEPSAPVGGTMRYSIDGNIWTEELPVGINAGPYFVQYRIVGADGYDTVDFTQKVSVTIAPAPINPTISIEGWTYGEEPNEPVVEGNEGKARVSYDYRNVATGETYDAAPTQVGTYEVKARIVAVGNYEYGETNTVQFTISPAKISDVAIPVAIDGLVYTGQPQNLVQVEPTDGVTVNLSGDGGQTWSTQSPTGTNAGGYTVMFRLVSDDGHEFADDVQIEGSVTALIDRARFVPELNIEGWTYGQPANQPWITTNPGGGKEVYAYFPLDSTDENPFPTAEEGAMLDAGTYEAYVTVEETQNYVGGSAMREFTVLPAQVNVTAPVARTGLVADGTEKQLVDPGATTGGTMMYSLGGDTYSADVPKAASAGTYTVYYKVDGGTNYVSTQPAIVWVTIEAPSNDSIAPSAASGLSYTGDPQQLVAPARDADGLVEYAINGGAWSLDVPSATNAGTYVVSYRPVGSSQDVADAPSVSVTVAKAAISPTVSMQGWTYGQAASEPQMTGNDGNAAVTYEYTLEGRNAYSAEAPRDAGAYQVRATVQPTDNYEGAQAVARFAIAKADPSVTAPQASVSLAYTGRPQALVSAGSAQGGQVQYSLDGQMYSTDIPTAINAGTYSVYYRVLGDANHNDVAAAQVPVVIAKAAANAEEEPQAVAGLTYGGNAQALVSAPQAEGATIEYSLDGVTWSNDVPTATNAGNYNVWYRAVGDANYAVDESVRGPLAVSIAKAAIAPSVSMTGWTYGQAASEPQVAGNMGNAAVSFAYATYPANEPLSGKPADAGIYTVTATVQESDNYLGAITAPAAFSISMADATVTTAPAARRGLVYSGSPQQLVSAGQAQGTQLQYSLNGAAWTTAVPTATTAGTYTVRYRVQGDANYNGTSEVSIAATIDRASATVTANNAAKVAGASDPTLTASVSGMVNGESAAMIAYTLARAAGETAGSYVITASGDAIQGNYNVTFNNATFTITQPAASAGGTTGGTSSSTTGASTGAGSGTARATQGSGSAGSGGQAATQSGSSSIGASSGAGSGSTVREATVGTTGTAAATTGGTATTVTRTTGATTSTTASAATGATGATGTGAAASTATQGTDTSDDADDAADDADDDAADNDDDELPETSGNAAAGDDDDSAGEEADLVDEGAPYDASQSIDDEANPLADGLDDETIGDDESPLASGVGADPWSPFNLVATLLTIAAALALGVREFVRRDEDNRKRQIALGLASLVPAIAAVALQVTTQDPSQPMALFNSMSPLFGAAAVVSAVIAGASVLSDRGNADEDYSMAF